MTSAKKKEQNFNKVSEAAYQTFMNPETLKQVASGVQNNINDNTFTGAALALAVDKNVTLSDEKLAMYAKYGLDKKQALLAEGYIRAASQTIANDSLVDYYNSGNDNETLNKSLSENVQAFNKEWGKSKYGFRKTLDILSNLDKDGNVTTLSFRDREAQDIPLTRGVDAGNAVGAFTTKAASNTLIGSAAMGLSDTVGVNFGSKYRAFEENQMDAEVSEKERVLSSNAARVAGFTGGVLGFGEMVGLASLGVTPQAYLVGKGLVQNINDSGNYAQNLTEGKTGLLGVGIAAFKLGTGAVLDYTTGKLGEAVGARFISRAGGPLQRKAAEAAIKLAMKQGGTSLMPLANSVTMLGANVGSDLLIDSVANTVVTALDKHITQKYLGVSLMQSMYQDTMPLLAGRTKDWVSEHEGIGDRYDVSKALWDQAATRLGMQMGFSSLRRAFSRTGKDSIGRGQWFESREEENPGNLDYYKSRKYKTNKLLTKTAMWLYPGSIDNVDELVKRSGGLNAPRGLIDLAGDDGNLNPTLFASLVTHSDLISNAWIRGTVQKKLRGEEFGNSFWDKFKVIDRIGVGELLNGKDNLLFDKTSRNALEGNLFGTVSKFNDETKETTEKESSQAIFKLINDAWKLDIKSDSEADQKNVDDLGNALSTYIKEADSVEERQRRYKDVFSFIKTNLNVDPSSIDPNTMKGLMIKISTESNLVDESGKSKISFKPEDLRNHVLDDNTSEAIFNVVKEKAPNSLVIKEDLDTETREAIETFNKHVDLFTKTAIPNSKVDKKRAVQLIIDRTLGGLEGSREAFVEASVAISEQLKKAYVDKKFNAEDLKSVPTLLSKVRTVARDLADGEVNFLNKFFDKTAGKLEPQEVAGVVIPRINRINALMLSINPDDSGELLDKYSKLLSNNNVRLALNSVNKIQNTDVDYHGIVTQQLNFVKNRNDITSAYLEDILDITKPTRYAAQQHLLAELKKSGEISKSTKQKINALSAMSTPEVIEGRVSLNGETSGFYLKQGVQQALSRLQRLLNDETNIKEGSRELLSAYAVLLRKKYDLLLATGKDADSIQKSIEKSEAGLLSKIKGLEITYDKENDVVDVKCTDIDSLDDEMKKALILNTAHLATDAVNGSEILAHDISQSPNRKLLEAFNTSRVYNYGKDVLTFAGVRDAFETTVFNAGDISKLFYVAYDDIDSSAVKFAEYLKIYPELYAKLGLCKESNDGIEFLKSYMISRIKEDGIVVSLKTVMTKNGVKIMEPSTFADLVTNIFTTDAGTVVNLSFKGRDETEAKLMKESMSSLGYFTMGTGQGMDEQTFFLFRDFTPNSKETDKVEGFYSYLDSMLGDMNSKYLRIENDERIALSPEIEKMLELDFNYQFMKALETNKTNLLRQTKFETMLKEVIKLSESVLDTMGKKVNPTPDPVNKDTTTKQRLDLTDVLASEEELRAFRIRQLDKIIDEKTKNLAQADQQEMRDYLNGYRNILADNSIASNELLPSFDELFKSRINKSQELIEMHEVITKLLEPNIIRLSFQNMVNEIVDKYKDNYGDLKAKFIALFRTEDYQAYPTAYKNEALNIANRILDEGEPVGSFNKFKTFFKYGDYSLSGLKNEHDMLAGILYNVVTQGSLTRDFGMAMSKRFSSGSIASTSSNALADKLFDDYMKEYNDFNSGKKLRIKLVSHPDSEYGPGRDDGTVRTTKNLQSWIAKLIGLDTNSYGKQSLVLNGSLIKCVMSDSEDLLSNRDKESISDALEIPLSNVKIFSPAFLMMFNPNSQKSTDVSGREFFTGLSLNQNGSMVRDLDLTTEGDQAILRMMFRSMALHQRIASAPIEHSTTRQIPSLYASYTQKSAYNQYKALAFMSKLGDEIEAVKNGSSSFQKLGNVMASFMRKQQQRVAYYGVIEELTEESINKRVVNGDSVDYLRDRPDYIDKNETISINGNLVKIDLSAHFSINIKSLYAEALKISKSDIKTQDKKALNEALKRATAYIAQYNPAAKNPQLLKKVSDDLLKELANIGVYTEIEPGVYGRIADRFSNDGTRHDTIVVLREVKDAGIEQEGIGLNRQAAYYNLADFDGDTLTLEWTNKAGQITAIAKWFNVEEELVSKDFKRYLGAYLTEIGEADEFINNTNKFYNDENNMPFVSDKAPMYGGMAMKAIERTNTAAIVLMAKDFSLHERPLPVETKSPTVENVGTYSKDKTPDKVTITLPQYKINGRAMVKNTVFFRTKQDGASIETITNAEIKYTKMIDNRRHIMVQIVKQGKDVYANIIENDNNGFGAKIHTSRKLVGGGETSLIEAMKSYVAPNEKDITINGLLTNMENHLIRQGNVTLGNTNIFPDGMRCCSTMELNKQMSNMFTNNNKTNFAIKFQEQFSDPEQLANKLSELSLEIAACSSLNIIGSVKDGNSFVNLLAEQGYDGKYTIGKHSVTLQEYMELVDLAIQDKVSSKIEASASRNPILQDLLNNVEIKNEAKSSLTYYNDVFTQQKRAVLNELRTATNHVNTVENVFKGVAKTVDEITAAYDYFKGATNKEMFPPEIETFIKMCNYAKEQSPSGSHGSIIPSNLRHRISTEDVVALGFTNPLQIFTKEYQETMTKLNRAVYLMDNIQNAVSPSYFNKAAFAQVTDMLTKDKVYLNAEKDTVKTVEDLATWLFIRIAGDKDLQSAETFAVSKDSILRFLQAQSIGVSDEIDTVAEQNIGVTVTRGGAGVKDASNISDLLGIKSAYQTGNYRFLIDTSNGNALNVTSFVAKLQEFISSNKSTYADFNIPRGVHKVMVDTCTPNNRTALYLASIGVNSKALKILSNNTEIASLQYTFKDIKDLTSEEKGMPLYGLNEEIDFVHPKTKYLWAIAKSNNC